MNKNTNIVCYSLFDDEDLTSCSCENTTIVDNAIDENIPQDINNCNEEQTIHQFKEWEDKSHLKGYKQNKRCSKCGRPIPDKNKSGICCVCSLGRDLSGANNPFYGKTHSEETRNKLRVSCAIASEKLWQDEEYRNKVVQNATGLKRDEKFKETQRQHAYKQFQDKHQRDIRSERMK